MIDEQSSASGHDYASDGSAIGAGSEFCRGTSEVGGPPFTRSGTEGGVLGNRTRFWEELAGSPVDGPEKHLRLGYPRKQQGRWHGPSP